MFQLHFLLPLGTDSSLASQAPKKVHTTVVANYCARPRCLLYCMCRAVQSPTVIHTARYYQHCNMFQHVLLPLGIDCSNSALQVLHTAGLYGPTTYCTVVERLCRLASNLLPGTVNSAIRFNITSSFPLEPTAAMAAASSFLSSVGSLATAARMPAFFASPFCAEIQFTCPAYNHTVGKGIVHGTVKWSRVKWSAG